MKAAIYSPYLDTLGGGERYVLSFAVILRNAGWDVYIESKSSNILDKIENKFGIETSGLRIVESVKRGSGYDLCFWLSDGSIPTLFSRNNILHFQRPFGDVDGRSLMNRMKFFRINTVVVNSKFTKTWIDKEYPQESVVLYPPIDVENFRPGRKENTILYVGRFSQLGQSKKQDKLVEVFKKMYDKDGSVLRKKGWKLILAGGSEVGRTEFVDKLRQEAKTYPISIIENASFKKIKNLYSSAKVFWSAAGFGVDEEKHPEKTEHFGISVVEAMSAGAVPVIYAAGGHKEIVGKNKYGYLWGDKSDLETITEKLATNRNLVKITSKACQTRSLKYSYLNFHDGVLSLI